MKVKGWMMLAAVCSIFWIDGAAGRSLQIGQNVPLVEAMTQEYTMIKLNEAATNGWVWPDLPMVPQAGVAGPQGLARTEEKDC